MLLDRNKIIDGVGILTDKQGNEWIVDLGDFEKCSEHFWTDNGKGYAKSMLVGYLHRFLRPDLTVVDHIDRNRRNNRRSNLRSGGGVNGLNKENYSASGYKAVHRMRDKWQARPMRNYLGTFETPQEAHEAVIAWAEPKGLKEFYLL